MAPCGVLTGSLVSDAEPQRYSSSATSETGDLKGEFAGMTAMESVEQKSKAKVDTCAQVSAQCLSVSLRAVAFSKSNGAGLIGDRNGAAIASVDLPCRCQH